MDEAMNVSVADMVISDLTIGKFFGGGIRQAVREMRCGALVLRG